MRAIFVFVCIPWKDGTTRDEGRVGSTGVQQYGESSGVQRSRETRAVAWQKRGRRSGRRRWRSRYVQ